MAARTLSTESFLARALLIGAAVLIVLFAYFATKWFLANTIASRAQYKEVAELAVGLAPSDPQTNFSAGVLFERTFVPEDLPVSIAAFEKAAILSPYDYRLWLELGKARERSGDSEAAERAMRKALELAPHYSRVQWALGNNLLRQGRSDEAFVEIRRAAEGDKTFAGPAVSSAWQIFDGDVPRVTGYVGDSANLKAAFSTVLARESRFDEAVAVWTSIPADARVADFRAEGDDLYSKLIVAKRFRAAMTFVSGEPDRNLTGASSGAVTNGGFEADVPKTSGAFDWVISDGIEPQIGVDNAVRRDGAISLKLIFNSADGKGFRNVSQVVVVEAGKPYRFRFFAKSELKASGTLRWEVVDAVDGKTVLATTDAIPATADWTEFSAVFTAPANAEAVVIRLARVPCQASVCPIAGRAWFDDFSMEATN